MPAALAVEDLANWLGQTIAIDDARALLVVSSANGQVRAAAPAGDSWDDEDWPQIAFTVAISAAARAWVNPTGANKLMGQRGPFTDDKSWNESAGVLLTSDEKDLLAGLGLPEVGGVPGLSSFRITAPAGSSPSGGTRARLQQYDGGDE